MNVLDRYLGKSILSMIFTVLFLIVGLAAIIKFVEQLRDVGSGNYDTLHAVIFTLFTIPKDIETLFPMAGLLGALLALGQLASGSELIVIQAAGYSRFKIGLSVIKTAIPLVILTMIIGEWGIPQSEQFARNMRSQALSGGSLLSIKNGVWAKEGNNFIYIQQVVNEKTLRNIYVYQFDDQRNLLKVSYGNQANYQNHRWIFEQSNESILHPDYIENINQFNKLWETSLTPDKLGIVSLRPTSLSLSELYDYIHFLKETGQESNRFELTFWRKIFQPLSVAVMMLLALSFIFGPLRSVTMGARMITGIMFGFLFYVINEIFGPLSLVYSIAPIIGAIIPSAFFLLVAWGLLKRKPE